MTWWAILRSDGDLESVGETVASDADLASRGLTKLALASQPDFALVVWDKISQALVPRPADVVRDRIGEMMADAQIVLLSSLNRTRVQTALVKYFGDVRSEG